MPLGVSWHKHLFEGNGYWEAGLWDVRGPLGVDVLLKECLELFVIKTICGVNYSYLL